MKLLFIMETMRARGAERVASILVDQLSNLQHEVYLVCTGFVRGEEFSLPENVHLEFIPPAEGSRLHLLLIRIRYIRQKITEIKPDCILSLAAARTLFMITAGNLGLSVPMIFSERHDPAHNPDSKAERILRFITYHACDRIVFQTKRARSYFSSSIARKGVIIANPIKEDLPNIQGEKRKPYIVSFSKLVPQKNLSLLLRAFAKISPARPSLRLAIYGDGELRDSLESEAKELGIHSKTDFHPHALDIHEQIKDCFMFVSSSDYEGQSNSMLEAMAMGFPCVCTDCPCGGARAVIHHGINGLLVPVGNTEKLAKAMSYMYDHPDEADRMGKNATLIREERRPDRIAKKWDRLIYKTVSKRNR